MNIYVKPNPYFNGGVHRDCYPILRSEVTSGCVLSREMFIQKMRDPMDTPRAIGFRANHRERK